MDEWSADVEADELPNGMYVAVLVFTSPPEIGQPIRRMLEGEYDHPELARLAALDAFVLMTHG